MLFNSLSFALFFPVVFILYWFVTNKNLRLQNIMLVAASYFFYCCWDWRFGFLLAFSTLLDFYSGLALAGSTTKSMRKFWLILSVGINLGFLGFFKYYNFFVESFAAMLTGFGLEPNIHTLNIILPVGISFYTFHGLSYVLDIYYERIQPTRNLANYTLFVSFFPLLVAGPIERATHLLPQIMKPREFKYAKAVDGLKQILWGLVKKVIIADSCAEYANIIFNNSADYNGSTLFIGALFFTFQIYGDFSGYTDIALGTARMLGFELYRNFNYPYFSRDIAEFWRKWHISLSSWFRDYLYIPLGGSKGGLIMKIRNTFIIFLVSGFWHGANWTFIAWGALNAIYFLPLLITNNNRVNVDTVAQGKFFPSVREFYGMATTFTLTVLAWVFFRAENIGHAVEYISTIFSFSLFEAPSYEIMKSSYLIAGFVVLFMLVEWLGREYTYAIANLETRIKQPYIRFSIYYILVIAVLWYSGKEQEFIYFQF